MGNVLCRGPRIGGFRALPVVLVTLVALVAMAVVAPIASDTDRLTQRGKTSADDGPSSVASAATRIAVSRAEDRPPPR